MNEYIEADNKIREFLEIDRKTVGVRFLKTKLDFEKSKANKMIGEDPYCVLIKLASIGEFLKADLSNFSCEGGIKALCLDSELEKSGYGIHENEIIAEQYENEMVYLEEETYGIEAGPIEIIEEPDVVIIITIPNNAMRIIHGYNYKYGHNDNYRISGNQSICSECTAVPYLRNNMNMTMMCPGARRSAKWKEEEMALGFSTEKFLEVADGVYKFNNKANEDK